MQLSVPGGMDMRKPVIAAVAALLVAVTARAEDKTNGGPGAPPGLPGAQSGDTKKEAQKSPGSGARSDKARGKAPVAAEKGRAKQQQAKPCEETKPCAIE